MSALFLGRWVLWRLATHPGALPVALGLGGLVYLLAALTPPGSAAGPALALGMTCAWLHPAACLGVALGLAVLAEAEGLLCILAPGPRWGAELGGLLCATVALQLPVLVAGVLAGAGLLGEGSAGWTALALSNLHTVALGLLALRIPGGTLVRIAAFVVLAWLVPPFLGNLGPQLDSLAGVIDSGRALRGTPPFGSPWESAFWAAPSLAGLFGLSRLLRIPSPARPIGT